MKLPAEETTAAPGHTWGDETPPPVNASPNIETLPSGAVTAKADKRQAQIIGKKPKNEKAAKITKSKAAELKEALEKRQLGDTTATPKAKKGKATEQKPERHIRKPKEEQRDLVDEGKLVVPTSPLYKAGKRLKDACIQEKLNDEEKAEAIADVLKCMKKARRYNYNVEGFGFELDHQGAKDKVRIIKPK